MANVPAIQFYVGDYLRDNVAGCSLAAQGLWLRMLLIMHDSEPYGHLTLNGQAMPDKVVASKCGTDIGTYARLLSELVEAGVPSFTEGGILYSRRMAKDEEKRRYEREKKRRQRCPGSVPPDVPPDVPPVVPALSPGSSSSTSSSIREGGSEPPAVGADHPPPTGDVDRDVREFFKISPLMPVWNQGEHDAMRKLVLAAGWPKARAMIAEVRKDPKVVSPARVALARLAGEQAARIAGENDQDNPEQKAKAAMALIRERRKATVST